MNIEDVKDEEEEKIDEKEANLNDEFEDDKCCITSRKDSISRVSSRSQQSKSLRSMGNDSGQSESLSSKPQGGRGPIMPEPLPLYEGEAHEEPSLMAGFRRATKVFVNYPGEGYGSPGYCPHEEVHDWSCKECKKRVA